MQGRRVPDDRFLHLRSADEIGPGDYGSMVITSSKTDIAQTDWFVCCPDGSITRLWVNEDDCNGNRHTITEHDDRTITVGGSILGHDIPSAKIGGVGPISSETWHGWLERGIWRSI